MPKKIHFITYGDGRAEYFEGSLRLISQAHATGWFDTVTSWNTLLLESMEPEWFKKHKAQFIDGSRGHGYWIWKAKIIEIMLQGISEGDILVYLDAGCEINALGKSRFNNYIDLVNQFGFLFFYLNGPGYQICQWTKAKLLKRFDLYEGSEEILRLPQMESGVLFFKNNKETRILVREWSNISVMDSYSLINDSPTDDIELKDFIENRHDQAILSLLFIKYEYGISIRNENYYPQLWNKYKHPELAPIGAFRNLTTESMIDRMKFISHDLPMRFLWIREGKPIYLDMKDLDLNHPLSIAMAEKGWRNSSREEEGRIDNENFFSLIAQKSNEIKEEVNTLRVCLLRALFNNRDHSIGSLNNGMRAKEEIIKSLGASLEERLSAILEKQSVIESQAITLDQRLVAISEYRKKNADLIKRLDRLEKKILFRKLAFRVWLWNQLRSYKTACKSNFISAYLVLQGSIKGLLQKNIHRLRVVKHALKYIPYHYERILGQLKQSYLNMCRRIGGVELGYLRTHLPRKIRVPISYYIRKSVFLDAPLISIVTPSYQQGQYIERTINSVLSQKYPNLEYVIQDGGSQDCSLEIIKQYQKHLSSFESKKDNGQSNAINLGFLKTSGEIMAWLNSDDILLPGALNYVGSFFKNHPDVDVVYGNRVIINEDDLEVARWIMPEHDDEVLSWADYVPQETLFWRRGIWERSGSKIDEKFDFAMDWDLLLRFRKVNAKIVRLPRLIGGFRVHSMQKTNMNIAKAGSLEMNRLRERELGFVPDNLEVSKHLKNYISTHQYENFKWKLLEFFKLL